MKARNFTLTPIIKPLHCLGLALLLSVLAACQTNPVDPNEQVIAPVAATTVTLGEASTVVAPVNTAAATPSAAPPPITIYSPYSSEGLQALNEFRSNNNALNDFLLRNRKPDYFFSGSNTEFSYQKIYLVYLGSENLYLFDSKLKEPYKKFHPLPATIKESFRGLKPATVPTPASPTTASAPASATTAASRQHNGSDESDERPAIEKTLSMQRPEPYLSAVTLYQIPRQGMEGETIYPELYFLDVPLNDMLENQYSARYDSQKHMLKLIFPRFYDADMLYRTPDSDTRKIPVEMNNGQQGRQVSLLVPDFMPGSLFYRNTRNNISKAFSSLYQVTVPPGFIDSSQLAIRYSIKLCQSDKLAYCAVKKDETTYVRAIVIEATLYDRRSRTPIETFVLK